MRNLLLMLTICALISCKKDVSKQLTSKNWRIESSTVTPAMTIGSKTSTDYLSLMGPGSCDATLELLFHPDGSFTQGSNGALCDLSYDPNNKTSITWSRNNERIILSTSPDAPFNLSGNYLTRKIKINSGGTVYTLVQVYKAK
jgi:hypothetical protein